MKKSLYLLPALAVALVGCSGPIPDANTQAETASTDKKTALGRSMDMAKNIDTDNNISQINQTLGMIKNDNEGKAPATIEEAKTACKGIPASMWIDSVTSKPLQYNPQTGTVSR
ncbi:hypothetical protein EON83_10500 [bacterium]|nr:MAG: hypothetical protein EON83_10500 [bacterium]